MNTFELDANRLLCPMPVIRTQNKIRTLQAGDILKVSATDPGVKQDIPTWCRINGHQVTDIHEEKDEIIITICVGEE